MIWVGWRQQRTETAIAAAILAALAAVLIPTGLEIASAYRDAGLSGCLGARLSDSCYGAIETFGMRFASLSGLIAWLTLVPGLIGVLLAAPLIVQLEHGTFRLDWTQSITRGRWIASKLGLAIATALVVSLVLVALVTWWRAPYVRLHGRMENSVFDAEGTVVFAYTLFAFGLATAAGVLWRRAVPAVLTGFAGYFVARIFVDTWLRERLLSPLSATWPLNARGPNLERAWIVTQAPSDRLGNIVAVPLPCKPAAADCPVDPNAAYMHAVYHPASQFWPLQIRETLLFGLVALALIAFSAYWTHRRAS